MESNNSKKLREALGKLCAYGAVVLNTGMFNRVHLEALLNMAKAALAAPVPVPPVPSNAAKLREALEYAQEVLYVDCNGEVHICANEVKRLSDKIKAALAAPPRNCDVGTADEQNNRHGVWCLKHDVNGDMEADCANNACSQCILKWGQMPYEKCEKKGVDNGSK